MEYRCPKDTRASFPIKFFALTPAS